MPVTAPKPLIARTLTASPMRAGRTRGLLVILAGMLLLAVLVGAGAGRYTCRWPRW
ncbi:hypothetical protein [Hymenobacter arcticus]